MSKLVLLLGALSLIAVGTLVMTHKSESHSNLSKAVLKQWKSFKKTHNKSYESEELENFRMNIFASNLSYIKYENSRQSEYTMAVNKFADLSSSEFAAQYLGLKPQMKKSNNAVHVNNGATLEDVDWRTKGAVQNVKDQGQCGSCWAFSTTASLESANAVFGSGLANISEQQLVDCSGSYGNMGCNGGLMDQAFEYIIDHGIQNEDAYPYTARDGSCKHDDGDNKMSSYTDVKAGSTSDLQNSNTQQPVSIAVDAMTWQFYSGGVFSNCGTSLDHGVLLAGYTSDYWIVKNSWGASWGEQGYIRLKSGNTCGLANMASYPTL